jgi:hypothetical protein
MEERTKNVEMELEGDILTIRIDLTQEHGLSSTGKSVTVASTGGNLPLGIDGIKLGINAFKPLPDSSGIFADIKRPAKRSTKKRAVKR